MTADSALSRLFTNIKEAYRPETLDGTLYPVRRAGASPGTIESIQKELHSRLTGFQDGSVLYTFETLFQLSLQVASLQFSLGFPADSWKKWLRFTAIGQFHAGEYLRSVTSAILADEWAFAESLKANLPFQETRVDTTCLTHLLFESTEPFPFEVPKAEMYEWVAEGFWEWTGTDAYGILISAVPAKDQEKMNTAFELISDHYLSIRDWNLCEPEFFPVFEPLPNALMKLAIRRGFDPTKLNDAQRILFETALTAGEDSFQLKF